MDINIKSETGKLKAEKRQLLIYRIDTLQAAGSSADDALNSFFEKISANTRNWLEHDVKKRLEREAAESTRRSRLDGSPPTYSMIINVAAEGEAIYKVTINSRFKGADKKTSFLIRTDKKRPLFIRIREKRKKEGFSDIRSLFKVYYLNVSLKRIISEWKSCTEQ